MLFALFSSEMFYLHLFSQGLLLLLNGHVYFSLWHKESGLKYFLLLHYLDLGNLTYLHLYGLLFPLSKDVFYFVYLCGSGGSVRESRYQRRPEEGVRYSGAELQG